VYVFPLVTVGLIVVLRFVLSAIIADMITSSVIVRIGVSVMVIFPMGMIMGFFFPTGMRLAQAASTGETPWYWALNGIMGVLSSALAVLFSIFIGISTNFYIAALCYALVLISLHRWNVHGEESPR
jgi:hypothetical protein